MLRELFFCVNTNGVGMGFVRIFYYLCTNIINKALTDN